MKGLLYKDFLVIKNYAKSFIIMFAVYVGIGFFNKGMNSFVGMACFIVALMAVISTFSYDEMAKWDSFALTMPITKKDIVKSKYVLVLISLVISFLVNIIIYYFISIYNKSDFNLILTINDIVTYMLGIGVVMSMFLPVFYKFGVEKGRLYFFVIPFALVIIIGGIGFIFKQFNISFAFLNNLTPYLDNYSVLIMIVLMLIVIYISYLISLKIYNKKEF